MGCSLSRVAVVSPGHPDTSGGVAGHTMRLVRTWRDQGHFVEVLGDIDCAPVETAGRWARDRIGGVLIQYVPFLYARLGVSRFPERLSHAARRAGMRVTVFVHEPWVPPTRLPWLGLSPLQRRQLRRLVALADAVVTAVPVWAEMLGGAELLHAGSTLGEPPDPMPPVESFPIAFSPFASGLNWELITTAVKAIGASPPLVVIGASAEQVRDHQRTRAWFDPRWEFRGYLSPPEALSEISRGRIALAPFVDGVTGRRTSVLALLSTGIPVVSTRGHLHDPFFDAAVTTALDYNGYARAARDVWESGDRLDDRARRREWYRRALEPRALDERLLDVMVGR